MNTAIQALLKFKARLVDGVEVAPRNGLDYSTNGCVTTAFLLCTITTRELIGELAQEGVHTDGVDHTMTIFLGQDNMSDGSGITFMHDMKQPAGVPWDAADDRWRLGQVQHRRFLDTLMVVDNERKHSVTPLRSDDSARDANRDMLILFSRRPARLTHPSAPYDSLESHAQFGTEFPISSTVAAL